MQPTTISSCKEKGSMILNVDEKGYVLSAAADRARPQDLTTRYRALLDEPRLSWIETHRMIGDGSARGAGGGLPLRAASGPTTSRSRWP